MTERAFTYKKLDNGVAVIEINVPNQAQNTLQASFIDDFNHAFAELGKANVKALVIISTKPGSFIAGADIDMINEQESAADIVALSKLGQEGFQRIEDLKIPVVAAISGACLGGGLELAMACSYRIADTASNTVMGLPEVMLGLLPAGGGTQRTPRLVGIANALDLMLTGRQLKAKPAKKLGLIHEICEPNALYEHAIARALALSKTPQKPQKLKRSIGQWLLEGTPMGRKLIFSTARKQAMKKSLGLYPAVPAIIDAVETGTSNGLKAGYAKEAKLFGDLAMSAVSKQLRGIFHATNVLKKETFVAQGTVPRDIKQVGVLGAGLMGAGIALTTANKAKLPVRLKDRDDKGLAHGVKYLNDFYSKRVKRGALTQSQADAEHNLASYSTHYDGFKQTDLVIEAVFESLDLKHQMLKDIEANGHEQTIFASNTSSIPITEIAKAAKRPENVIGLHYFSPVEKMPLLEIITTDKTAPEVTAACVQFGKDQGKTVIVVKDGPGFYTTRILAPYLNEATRMLTEGVAIDKVDKALMNFGFPVGPITLLDEVGVDVGTKVGPVLEAAFGERMKSAAAASVMIDNNFLGRKTGKGFYLYEGVSKKDKKNGKPINTALYGLMNVTSEKNVPDSEIVERSAWMMINEAAYCLQEGIIADPLHGDIGAIFGLGFPPFRGGPFRYLDTVGLDKAVATLNRLSDTYGERFKPAQILVDMAKEGRSFY